MQLVVLVLVYLLSAVVNHRPFKKNQKSQALAESNRRKIPLKESFLPALVGMIGVMLLNLLGQDEPLWPALAVIAVTAGEIYAFWGSGEKKRSGVCSFFGGIFYLNPVLALFSLGLALEIYWVGKNSLLGVLVFIGLVPILIWYSQMNPFFLGAAITTELLVIWGLKAEIWNKIKPQTKFI